MPSLPCLITEHAKLHFDQKNFRFLMEDAMMAQGGGGGGWGEVVGEIEEVAGEAVEDVKKFDLE